MPRSSKHEEWRGRREGRKHRREIPESVRRLTPAAGFPELTRWIFFFSFVFITRNDTLLSLPPSQAHAAPTEVRDDAYAATLDDPPCMAAVPVFGTYGAREGAGATVQQDSRCVRRTGKDRWTAVPSCGGQERGGDVPDRVKDPDGHAAKERVESFVEEELVG
jgi:hypothetical protein